MTDNEKKDTTSANGNASDDQTLNKSLPSKEHNGVEKNENPHGAKAKAEAAKGKLTDKKQKVKDKANPPGGHDSTPIPSAPDGYTVKFTFHRAENLPVADLKVRSSDPFIRATLTAPGITKRHKEDPVMILRTKTIHESTDPVWNQEWIVAGIPSSGFKLKCRLYDEDPSDADDRLGNVTVEFGSIGQSWSGMKEQVFDVKKRMGSKRAYSIRACAAFFSSQVHMNGRLVLSAEVLGKSDKPYGRMYTVAPVSWTKHYSPMIGRLAGTKAPASTEKDTNGNDIVGGDNSEDKGGKSEKYDFQANQIQLQGPVPASLYHRFVEFKPFVKGMFSKAGLRGRVLNAALHHQHARVYNYSKTTEYGNMEPHSEKAALQFLKMVHYDEGGRIFTYVLTLDGLLRFTETGKEFGIDLLSKHTMHSDVNIYVACSGEFFVRRLAHPDESATSPNQKTHPGDDLPGGPPHEAPPKAANQYELIIDNDSGTYRPKAELLPELQKFLEANFPGLHIVTKDGFDKKLGKMKKQQTEIKKKQGNNMEVMQNSDDDISSSDEEAMDNRVGGIRKKSKRAKAFAAVEDPSKMLKSIIPGEQGRKTREEKETQDDMAAEGEGSASK